jgi:hypothetical protein
VVLIWLVSACASLPRPDELSVVVQWNELALRAIRDGEVVRPTVASRQLFLLHAAMYDAWSAFEPRAKPYALAAGIKIPAAAISEAAKATAVSQAAYQILRREFSRFEGTTQAFRRQLNRLGLNIVTAPDPSTPAGIGYLAAQALLQARAADGANAAGGYSEITSAIYPQRYAPRNGDDPRRARFDPNRWQPLRVPYPRDPYREGRYLIDDDDPSTFGVQTFMTPHWGAVQPFALISGAQLRPLPPPRLGSSAPYVDAAGRQTTHDQAYRAQTAEIVRLNAALSEREKAIAEFWADGPRSESPPGHWNQLAHGLADRDRHSLDDDVKMFFALNAALLDAGIASWDSKRYYDYVRPLSAIHHLYREQTVRGWGGRNRGVVTLRGQQWQPYQQQTFITPSFPEYVSGHSAFSAAAATVLTLFTSSPSFFDGVTRCRQDIDGDGTADRLGEFAFRAGRGFYESGPSQDVVLRWRTLQEAADEAAYSRRLGGIHFQDGDLRGRELGRKIGELAFAKAKSYWEPSDYVVENRPSR